MKTFLYKKIDAFTDGISSGNPAGIVHLPKGVALPEAQMQSVARRFTATGLKDRVNEVAFCTPLDAGVYSLRYYSYNCEVELCGHATIALMYDLIKNSRELLDKESVIVRTAKAELPVINDIKNSGSVFISAPAPEHRACAFTWQDIAVPLRIPVDEIETSRKPSIVNGGLYTAVVPLKSLNCAVHMLPNESPLKEFSHKNNFDVAIVYTPEVSRKASRYRTRVFCPKYGYLEDPATGSGNAALGYYLLAGGVWDGGLISIEQGPDIEHPNIVKLKTAVINGVRRVQVGGSGVVRFEQEITL